MAQPVTGPMVSRPRVAPDDVGWLMEIAAVERAVDTLLNVKRQAMRDNPQIEQVLWRRHVERLREIKRKLDAVCL